VALPSHAKYLIIGAGVHGLSAAYHLSRELKTRGEGSGADILMLDKSGIIGAFPWELDLGPERIILSLCVTAQALIRERQIRYLNQSLLLNTELLRC